jgi:hypothetical protein
MPSSQAPFQKEEGDDMPDRMIADLKVAALDELTEEAYRRHRAADLQHVFASVPEPRRSPRFRRPALVVAGTAAAAGLAASVIIAPQLIQGGRNTPTGVNRPSAAHPGNFGKPVDARSFLLAAAKTAAETPVGTGAYWYTRQRTFDKLLHNDYLARKEIAKLSEEARNRKGKELAQAYDKALLGYVVYKSSIAERWQGKSAKDGSRSVRKDVPELTFASPEDQAKWKADGSPKLFDTEPAQYDDQNTDRFVSISNPSLTMDNLDELPTSAEALERELRVLFKAYTKRMGAGSFDEYVWQTGIDLFSAPTPPKVRAAMFRVMADQPGFTTKGTATDSLGRTGTVLTIVNPPADDAPHGTRSHMIIDPETAEMLQHEIVDAGDGKAMSRVTLEDAGWVNERGERP